MAKSSHKKTKAEHAARRWVPPEDTAPSPSGPTPRAHRQKRVPSRGYESGKVSHSEVAQRTRCQCLGGTIAVTNLDGMEVCMKCGKRPRPS